ncbi:hypothetical protein Poli38472_006535 [Pythium oligandrum]|uniref:Uncharacterized protein n=1 Tax=Pythium oligandrum TaxID=41045 RepID=A0A8K1C533_PYTOL|nr:hypothetical protein Poli38472_006535 [Pythium oligandrum]|eukprot:TMW56525.1 hypothetical protein Poli38472_006535 [Pythium oligandrum]
MDARVASSPTSSGFEALKHTPLTIQSPKTPTVELDGGGFAEESSFAEDFDLDLLVAPSLGVAPPSPASLSPASSTSSLSGFKTPETAGTLLSPPHSPPPLRLDSKSETSPGAFESALDRTGLIYWQFLGGKLKTSESSVVVRRSTPAVSTSVSGLEKSGLVYWQFLGGKLQSDRRTPSTRVAPAGFNSPLEQSGLIYWQFLGGKLKSQSITSQTSSSSVRFESALEKSGLVYWQFLGGKLRSDSPAFESPLHQSGLIYWQFLGGKLKADTSSSIRTKSNLVASFRSPLERSGLIYWQFLGGKLKGEAKAIKESTTRAVAFESPLNQSGLIYWQFLGGKLKSDARPTARAFGSALEKSGLVYWQFLGGKLKGQNTSSSVRFKSPLEKSGLLYWQFLGGKLQTDRLKPVSHNTELGGKAETAVRAPTSVLHQANPSAKHKTDAPALKSVLHQTGLVHWQFLGGMLKDPATPSPVYQSVVQRSGLVYWQFLGGKLKSDKKTTVASTSVNPPALALEPSKAPASEEESFVAPILAPVSPRFVGEPKSPKSPVSSHSARNSAMSSPKAPSSPKSPVAVPELVVSQAPASPRSPAPESPGSPPVSPAGTPAGPAPQSPKSPVPDFNLDEESAVPQSPSTPGPESLEPSAPSSPTTSTPNLEPQESPITFSQLPDFFPMGSPSLKSPPPGSPRVPLSTPLASPLDEVEQEQSPTRMKKAAKAANVYSPNDTENDEDMHSDDELGTPLGAAGGGFGDYDDEELDFSSHRFIGPSVAGDDRSARALHSLRRVLIHAKPPRFASEAAAQSLASFPSRRSSSAADSEYPDRSSRSSSLENSLNVYRVTFSEPNLGFRTRISVSQSGADLMVQVASVDRDSAAARAGVVAGDVLVSVNDHGIEPHMTEEQVEELFRSLPAPRSFVFSRNYEDRSSSKGSNKGSGVFERRGSNPLSHRLSSAISFGSSILGSALKRRKAVVHKDVMCDGCGVESISGALWSCSVCSHYNLCTDCYEMGTHGMEDTEAMQMLNEAIVQHKLQKKCKHFTPEFLLSLRRDVCKNRPDKFEYLGTWIADIVNGKSATKITVRGIEIPNLHPTARQRFVSKLMVVVSNRTDIDVNIEWLQDDTTRASTLEVDDDYPQEDLEKLRIWISDKKTRIASPFTA